jgi:hypothetical protein
VVEETDVERAGKGCVMVDDLTEVKDDSSGRLLKCNDALKKRSRGSSEASVMADVDEGGSKGPSIVADVGTDSSS